MGRAFLLVNTPARELAKVQSAPAVLGRSHCFGGSLMRKLAIFAAMLALVPTDPAVGKVNNNYAKWRLGQPFGFRDLKVSANRWKIRSLSYHAGMDFTTAMALHRAAVHAKANGFSNFYTVSLKVTCSNLFNAAPSGCQSTALTEQVDIVASGFNQGDPIPQCEERGRWAVNCKQFVVDELLETLRAPLGLSAEQVQQEVADVRAKVRRRK